MTTVVWHSADCCECTVHTHAYYVYTYKVLRHVSYSMCRVQNVSIDIPTYLDVYNSDNYCKTRSMLVVWILFHFPSFFSISALCNIMRNIGFASSAGCENQFHSFTVVKRCRFWFILVLLNALFSTFSYPHLSTLKLFRFTILQSK